MRLRRLLVVALLLLGAARIPACLAAPQAMVAAAHPLAVEAGLEVLRRGGSAVDAAIAVQMVLGVVEPQASGLGGGGFLLHYDGATGAMTVYDGRETAPAGATPTMFLDRDGKPLGFREATVSGISVGVPGALAMLELAHKEQGKLAWSELFQPAIEARARGFFGVAAPRRVAEPRCRSCATSRTYARPTSTPTTRRRRSAIRVRQSGACRDDAADRRPGRAGLLRGRHRGRDGRARSRPCAARHPVARRPRGLPADQARGGVRSLSRLDRLRHAAALVGRHRHPAGAGADRAVRHLARSARQPACAPPHRRGEPARLRRPRPLRRRSGVRAGAGGRAALAGLYRRAPHADVGRPQHGHGRARPAARLCRARHQPYQHRRSLGQRGELHHHHRSRRSARRSWCAAFS